MEENMVQTEAPAQRELEEQELVDFVREYPGVDNLPEPVIRAVRQGQNLSHAYGRHEVQQLRQTNAKLQQQLERLQNLSGGVGSLRSTGGDRSADSFLMGFNED